MWKFGPAVHQNYIDRHPVDGGTVPPNQVPCRAPCKGLVTGDRQRKREREREIYIYIYMYVVPNRA